MDEKKGRKHKQLVDDLQEKKRYSNLKEVALDHTCFRRG
jgi:hypothetical protein